MRVRTIRYMPPPPPPPPPPQKVIKDVKVKTKGDATEKTAGKAKPEKELVVKEYKVKAVGAVPKKVSKPDAKIEKKTATKPAPIIKDGGGQPPDMP